MMTAAMAPTTTAEDVEALLAETVVTFRQASSRLTPARNGKPINIATFQRWRYQGLETFMQGGIRFTTMEALARFFAARTAARNGTVQPEPTTGLRSPSRRQRESEAAGRQLDAMNV